MGGSENAPPWQDQITFSTKTNAFPGVAGHGPSKWRETREALRERNVLQPDASPSASPVQKPWTLLERSPVAVKARKPEFRNLDGGSQTATPAGRASGPFMDVPLNNDLISLASLAASPPVAPVSTGVLIMQEAPPFPRELALETPFSAREVVDCSPSAPSLSFSIRNTHPMVTPEEKTSLEACLQVFSEAVEQEGGFREYFLRENCELRKALARQFEGDEPQMTAEELLRRSAESMLRQIVRYGGESVTVQLGGICCMGMKKVVKVNVSFEDFEMQQSQLSICWDWDVKLEQKSCHAESD